MQELDLLKLYIPKEDRGPRSHISCRGDYKLYELINRIIQEIATKDEKIYFLAKKIGYIAKVSNIRTF